MVLFISVSDKNSIMETSMNYMFFVLSTMTLSLCLPTNANLGLFWQLTDVHYDSNYSQFPSAQYMCHSDQDSGKNLPHSERTHGEYGDYNCDSPWRLVVAAIDKMKTSDEPDFILWTGDSVPHAPDKDISANTVFSLVKNVTDKLISAFPDTPIYPSLGNHDIWPQNQFSPGPAQYYQNILSSSDWDRLLGQTEMERFKAGGYYSRVTRYGLRVISLNSNLWYEQDQLIVNNTDPAGQFEWLDNTLSQAAKDKQQVLISGHVPPGTLARSGDIRWFYPHFNARFLTLLQKYSSIIHTAIFGHEHTDSFRVVYDKNGKPVISMLMAPAITPWKSTVPGLGANNPGVRLYTYNRITGEILDYTQYYLDLSEANANKSANWKVEYTVKKAYKLENVLAQSLDGLINTFKDESKDVFDKYYLYNSVSYDNVSKCSGQCRKDHICALSVIDYAEYQECVNQKIAGSKVQVATGKNTTRRHHHHKEHHKVPRFMYFVIGSLVVVVVILFVILAVFCCRRRHVVSYLRQPRYVLLNPDGSSA